jgi:hypothetical protein
LVRICLICGIFLSACAGPTKDFSHAETQAIDERTALEGFWDCMFSAARQAKQRIPDDKAAMIQAISPLCEREYLEYLTLSQRGPKPPNVQEMKQWRLNAARRAVTVETADGPVR